MEDTKTFYRTISNIPFIVVGFLIFELVSVMWGLSVIFMGIGSYYSNLVRSDWFPDWVGVFLAYTMQIAYCTYFLTDLNIFYVAGILLTNQVCLNYTYNKKVMYRIPVTSKFVLDFNLNQLYIAIIYFLSVILSFIALPAIFAFTSLVVYATALILKSRSSSLWHIGVCIGISIIFLGFLLK